MARSPLPYSPAGTVANRMSTSPIVQGQLAGQENWQDVPGTDYQERVPFGTLGSWATPHYRFGQMLGRGISGGADAVGSIPGQPVGRLATNMAENPWLAAAIGALGGGGAGAGLGMYRGENPLTYGGIGAGLGALGSWWLSNHMQNLVAQNAQAKAPPPFPLVKGSSQKANSPVGHLWNRDRIKQADEEKKPEFVVKKRFGIPIVKRHPDDKVKRPVPDLELATEAWRQVNKPKEMAKESLYAPWQFPVDAASPDLVTSALLPTIGQKVMLDARLNQEQKLTLNSLLPQLNASQAESLSSLIRRGIGASAGVIVAKYLFKMGLGGMTLFGIMGSMLAGPAPSNRIVGLTGQPF